MLYLDVDRPVSFIKERNPCIDWQLLDRIRNDFNAYLSITTSYLSVRLHRSIFCLKDKGVRSERSGHDPNTSFIL